MANTGSGSLGNTYIGMGNGASGHFVPIGTSSGLTAHSVVIAQNAGAFTVALPSTTGFVLTSNGGGADPTFQPVSISGAVIQLTGNSGVATPTAGNINVITANSTVKFTGSGSTLTQDFNLSNLALGTSLPSLAGGIENVIVGGGSTGSATTTGILNSIYGWNAATKLTTGSNNTVIGCTAALNATVMADTVACGYNALNAYTTGTGTNTALGSASLNSLLTGTRNIAVGYLSGSSYVAAESSNILIGNTGTAAESNVIRIGSQGSGAGQQLQTHIAGVINTVSGRVIKVTSPGAYPYTTLTTDHLILVDSSAARTIVPLAAPVTGTLYYIKDSVGSAGVNNITITPSGKNIDGAASAVISSPYGAATIVYNGTEWNQL